MDDVEILSQIEDCIEEAIEGCGYKLNNPCGNKTKTTVSLAFGSSKPAPKPREYGDCEGMYIDQQILIGIGVDKCDKPSRVAMQVTRKIERAMLNSNCPCKVDFNYVGTIKDQTQKKGLLYWENEYILSYYDPTAIL